MHIWHLSASRQGRQPMPGVSLPLQGHTVGPGPLTAAMGSHLSCSEMCRDLKNMKGTQRSLCESGGFPAWMNPCSQLPCLSALGLLLSCTHTHLCCCLQSTCQGSRASCSPCKGSPGDGDPWRRFWPCYPYALFFPLSPGATQS